jgi:crotonobetainyl-CoA hydratase/dehydration protein DpgD
MQGLDHPLPAAFEKTYPEELLRRKSADALEGPRAFSEKRAPVWQGR